VNAVMLARGASHPAAVVATVQRIVDHDTHVIARKAPLSTRFAADAGRDVELGGSVSRPSWRGRVHLIGLCLAAPSLTLLILFADSTRARIGAAVYAVGLCSMLAVSVTYHRWVHDLRARAVWRRADHAMIFAAIAGSTTPIVLIAMPDANGIALISVVWAMSLLGAAFKIGHWHHGDVIGSVFYAAVSLVTVLSLPALWRNDGVGPAMCFIAAGLLYIVGAIWFASRRPRLRPTVFSYHEVWHVFTLLAATAHFAAVWAIAT
jgi:hemolysin III